MFQALLSEFLQDGSSDGVGNHQDDGMADAADAQEEAVVMGPPPAGGAGIPSPK